jgi:hypothetical protein
VAASLTSACSKKDQARIQPMVDVEIDFTKNKKNLVSTFPL